MTHPLQRRRIVRHAGRVARRYLTRRYGNRESAGVTSERRHYSSAGRLMCGCDGCHVPLIMVMTTLGGRNGTGFTDLPSLRDKVIPNGGKRVCRFITENCVCSHPSLQHSPLSDIISMSVLAHGCCGFTWDSSPTRPSGSGGGSHL